MIKFFPSNSSTFPSLTKISSMKKMILSLLVAVVSASASAIRTNDEVIIMQKGGNCITYVLQHYNNDVRLVYRAPVGLNNSDLKNLGIPTEAWPLIKSNGDMIFSLNHYNDTKKIESLQQEIAEKKETIRKQNLWLFIAIISLGVMTSLTIRGMVSSSNRWTIEGTLSKINRWHNRRRAEPYRMPLKAFFGGSGDDY